MMLRSGILILLSFIAFIVPSQARAGDAIQLFPLEMVREDAGCDFVMRQSSWQSNPVFLSSLDGTWMNINGRLLQLTGKPVTSKRISTYRAGEFTVTLRYGRAQQTEAGGVFRRAKITIETKESRRTFKVKGSCGC